MKKIAIVFSLMLFCVSGFAQEWNGTVRKDGKKSYYSYLTNDWADNLFIGVGGGISSRFTAGKYSDIKKFLIDPSVEVYLLKWFTPCVGARLGYLGFNGREAISSYMPYNIKHSAFAYLVDRTGQYVDSANEPGTLHYGSFHIHGDLMWNLVNTFAGYKRGRFYTISLYGSAGYLRLYDNINKGKGYGLFGKNYDQEFALGIGLYNTFRITDRLIATADLRLTNHASRYRSTTGVRTFVPALNIGLAYNVFKTTWTDTKAINSTLNEALQSAKDAEKRIAAAQKQNKDLENKVAQLSTELQEIKDEPVVRVDPVSYAKLKERAERADLVVYFYINQSTLNFSELHHLSNYASQVLGENPNHVFKVTGSADKGTGTPEINAKLSYARALTIKNILMKDFGVKESNIIISTVVTDKHADGALDRCALLEK